MEHCESASAHPVRVRPRAMRARLPRGRGRQEVTVSSARGSTYVRPGRFSLISDPQRGDCRGNFDRRGSRLRPDSARCSAWWPLSLLAASPGMHALRQIGASTSEAGRERRGEAVSVSRGRGDVAQRFTTEQRRVLGTSKLRTW